MGKFSQPQTPSNSFKMDKRTIHPYKESRLQRIMKLKTHRPSTQSTLKNYKPIKNQKCHPNKENISPFDNEILEIKRCRTIIKQENLNHQKQYVQWKFQERERQLKVKQNQKNRQISYRQEMSLQRKFDRMFQKQLLEMNRRKQMEERKYLGFSPYLFPSY